MKKRTSKDKPIKGSIQKKIIGKQKKIKNNASPLQTLNLLICKNTSLQYARQFEKSRIDRIILGRTQAAVQFGQIEKSCCFEEYLRKYYRLADTRHIFTGLITQNSLTSSLTFLDFKLRHFKIMNNYDYQKKQLGRGKCKDENNVTAQRSFTQEDRFFKEMEIGVKKLTENKLTPQKSTHNASTSFIHMLTKNIEKMIHNLKHDPALKQIDFKPIMNNNAISTPDISNIYHERIHTTPEPMACDFYGLGQYWNNSQQKNKKEVNISRNKAASIKQNAVQFHRFQTQYDTECIITSKKSKPKKLSTHSKTSLSKKKVLSKGKSPPSGLKCSLKIKK